MVKRLKNESYKKSMKESYSDINDDNVWEVFDYVKELLTPDELVQNMARWMGLDDLTKCMQHICRTQGINVLEDEMYEQVNIKGLRESNSYEEFSVIADIWSELIRKLEEATDLEIDSIYRDEPDKFIYGYDTDNNEYEIEVTRSRNGDYEILSDNVNLV